MKIHCVLFATDFSEASEPAFPVAKSLARDHRAKLIVLHVSTQQQYPVGEVVDEKLSPPEAEIRQLEQLVEQAGDVDCEYRWVYSEPPHEAASIVKTARNEHADLIVIGTHGRRGLSRMLAGSVAQEVIRTADCPVVTVRQKQANREMELAQ